MNITKSDNDVSDLNCKQSSDIKQAFNHFKGFGDVELFETIHGHIARFKIANEACHELDAFKGLPLRLTSKDYQFLARDLYRFVDASQLFIVVGVKSCR